MPDIQTLLSIAPSVSAIVAVLTFIVYVGNTIREQRRAFRELRSEANRRDWERLSALAQILHNKGDKAGLWAQTLAVRELGSLETKKDDVLVLATEAVNFWDANKDTAAPALQSQLRTVIENLRRRHNQLDPPNEDHPREAERRAGGRETAATEGLCAAAS